MPNPLTQINTEFKNTNDLSLFLAPWIVQVIADIINDI